MKKSIILTLLFATIISIFACKKEPLSSNNQATADRVSFTNYEAFKQTFNDLSKLSSTEEMRNWSKSKGVSNLLDTEDAELQKLPHAFLAILNKNAEFEMDNYIIWYHSGKLYKFDKQEEEAIESLKKSPEKCQVAGTASSELVKTAEERASNIPVNGNSNYQLQFTQMNYQPCGGNFTGVTGVRKYVHEVYSFSISYTTNGVPTHNVYLYLRLKLEYRTSNNRWRKAGEQRAMTVNVSGNASVFPGGIPMGFSINQSLTCANDVEALIGFQTVYGPINYWILNMSGTITHRVMGDIASNTWTNSGILW
jgi:hypothetical protein